MANLSKTLDISSSTARVALLNLLALADLLKALAKAFTKCTIQKFITKCNFLSQWIY